MAETQTLPRHAAEEPDSPVPDPEAGSSWVLEAGTPGALWDFSGLTAPGQ